MATLLIQLVGPMQSWGISSRFNERDTNKEPSKSGIIGLLAAALGIDRGNWNDLKPLTALRMAVRHDRPGILRRDYQTVACNKDDSIIKANGKIEKADGIVSNRYYLADAAFLVGLEGDDKALLKAIMEALKNPIWQLFLGRKSYLPSEPIWIEEGVRDESLDDTMLKWPWISSERYNENKPETFLLSIESKTNEGIANRDQPISSFEERRFGTRFVKQKVIPHTQGEDDASS